MEQGISLGQTDHDELNTFHTKKTSEIQFRPLNALNEGDEALLDEISQARNVVSIRKYPQLYTFVGCMKIFVAVCITKGPVRVLL